MTLDFTVSSNVLVGSYSEDGFTVDGTNVNEGFVDASLNKLNEVFFGNVANEYFQIINDLGELFTLDAFDCGSFGFSDSLEADSFEVLGFSGGSQIVDYGTFSTDLESVTETTNDSTLIDELRIVAAGLNQSTPLWDNIVLTKKIPAVPLPAGLPLLLAGIGGLGLMARRKLKVV